MTSEREKIKDHLKRKGKLEIISEIPEGMNAYSFHCRHKQLNEDQFVKVCYYEPRLAKEILREPRYLKEALRSSTNTSNLANVYDAEILDIGGEKYLCIQMEYIEGPDLLERMQESHIGMQDAVILASKILNGVAQLHNSRLVHRDIKPNNIMWNGGELKITDFGSVAMLADEKGYVSASRHSSLYTPPEGWEKPSLYGMSSDLYQVGIVLYEMINDALCYEEKHYLTRNGKKAILQQASRLEDLPRPDQCTILNQCLAERARACTLLKHGRPQKPYLTRPIVRIINKATNPAPDSRYQSATEFLSELAGVSCPNWMAIGPQIFTAENWQGRDWDLRKVKSKFVLKSKPAGGTRYRRAELGGSPSLGDCFKYVKNY